MSPCTRHTMIEVDRETLLGAVYTAIKHTEEKEKEAGYVWDSGYLAALRKFREDLLNKDNPYIHMKD